MGKGSGVGTQALGEGGVVFDNGPGGDEGIGSGTGGVVGLGGRERVAGGALDELVDANGSVGDVGSV
ncbi:hypothetical protein RNB18_50835, partial [Streptomyces sp. DSM 41640]|nr:hypothetical protein [Streptomyces sp. DSM 41640]